jgi:hypothetical protein
MKFGRRGEGTSAVEVTNVSPHGFWLFIGEREVFVSFQDFPWFSNATIQEIGNVELPSPHHLYWPDLDVDLAVDALDHPNRYPLISRVRPKKALEPSSRARRTSGAARR